MANSFKKTKKPLKLSKLRKQRLAPVRRMSWRRTQIPAGGLKGELCNAINPIDDKRCNNCGRELAENAVALDQDGKVIGTLVRRTEPHESESTRRRGDALRWCYDSAKKQAVLAANSDSIIRFEV